VLEFEAPIVENSDTPLILGLNDQDRFNTKGVNQMTNTVSFYTGPDMPVQRDNDLSVSKLQTQWELASDTMAHFGEHTLNFKVPITSHRYQRKFWHPELLEDPPKNTREKRHLREITSEDKYLLAIAVMCMNSTVGPEGL